MRFSIIPVTPYQQNCSLLICEKTLKAAVVDPGGDIDLILAAIDKEKVTVEAIFLTHGHLDHVGGAVALAELLSVPVYGPHRDDQFLLDGIPSQCKLFQFPLGKAFVPNQWLSDGDTIRFGEEILTVFHCPGHTPGHLVFYSKNADLALVGDVLFRGSIGRTDLARGNFNTLINSIRNKLWPLGKEVAFIPGHGPMSTFGQEMRSNPFVHL